MHTIFYIIYDTDTGLTKNQTIAIGPAQSPDHISPTASSSHLSAQQTFLNPVFVYTIIPTQLRMERRNKFPTFLDHYLPKILSPWFTKW
jgi:hypothetical protein